MAEDTMNVTVALVGRLSAVGCKCVGVGSGGVDAIRTKAGSRGEGRVDHSDAPGHRELLHLRHGLDQQKGPPLPELGI